MKKLHLSSALAVGLAGALAASAEAQVSKQTLESLSTSDTVEIRLGKLEFSAEVDAGGLQEAEGGGSEGERSGVAVGFDEKMQMEVRSIATVHMSNLIGGAAVGGRRSKLPAH